MSSVAVGSRVLISLEGSAEEGDLRIVARALRAADLDDDWVIPVMADAAALPASGEPIRGVAEFSTAGGPVRLDADFVHADGALVLRAPGLRTAAFTEQRRENVRGTVQLPLRGTVLAGGSAPGQGVVADLTGTTASVSAGGLAAELESAATMSAGARIYLELSMPGGDLAPCVLSVVACDEGYVRARFIDISPLDRERLVRLVFARQRAELAERRRTSDGLPS
jgi:hypothetical protein